MTFVLLIVLVLLGKKVVLKCVVMEYGVAYVVMSLMKEKHIYYVNSWAMDKLVCVTSTYYTIS